MEIIGYVLFFLSLVSCQINTIYLARLLRIERYGLAMHWNTGTTMPNHTARNSTTC
jgi:hypothetical protein